MSSKSKSKSKSTTTPAPAAAAAVTVAGTYPFGLQSMGLIGVLVKTDGTVRVFARKRPASGQPMEYLYKSNVLRLPPGGEADFTLGVDVGSKKEGVFSAEPLCWPGGYEVDRIHMLGTFNPFGADEIDYGDAYLNGKLRQQSIPANRTFRCRFKYDPTALPRFEKAVLTITDVDSASPSLGATCKDIIYVSAMDTINRDDGDRITDHGGVIVAVRLNENHYADGCAKLQFMNGATVDIDEETSGAKHNGLTTVVLNKTSESPR